MLCSGNAEPGVTRSGPPADNERGVDLLAPQPEVKVDDTDQEVIHVHLVQDKEGSPASIAVDSNFLFLQNAHHSKKPLLVLPEGVNPDIFK